MAKTKEKDGQQAKAPALNGFEASQAAFDSFATDARALDKRDVAKRRGDPERAFQNARIGVAAVFAHETEVRNELPRVDVDSLRKLPELAQAVAYAAKRAKQSKGARAANGLEKRAKSLRKLLLKSASALAEAGVIPERDLEKFRRPKAARDVATDCVELAALFRSHAGEVKGRTAVTVAQLNEATDIGGEIAKQKSASAEAAADGANAAEMRDRLWTLLHARHERLWRIAAFLFGKKKADKRVPALDARVPKKKLAALES